MRSASRSSWARWSVTPEVRECRSPPPSSSAVTTSPVAAFTSGGPPRKMVPWLRTITASSLMAERRRRRRCRSRAPRRSAGCPPRSASPGCRRSGRSGRGREDLVLAGRKAPPSRPGRCTAAGSGRRSPGRAGAFDRDRVVGAALTVASLATIMHSRPDTRPMPVMMPPPGSRRRTCRRRPAAPPPAAGCRGRADRRPGRAAAACRARRAGRGRARVRRAPLRPAWAQLLDEVHMRLAVGCR